MKIISLQDVCFLSCALAIAVSVSGSFAEIHISTPVDGTIVTPGQKVTVVATVDPIDQPALVIVGFDGGQEMEGTTVPFEAEVTVPEDVYGVLSLVVVAHTVNRTTLIAKRMLRVQPAPTNVVELRVSPAEMDLVTGGQDAAITVIGKLNDGTLATLSDVAAGTTYEVVDGDEEAVEISPSGVVTARHNGNMTLKVAFGDKSALVKIVVNVRNNMPQIEPLSDIEVAEGATLERAIVASDTDGDELEIRGGGLPPYVAVDDHGQGRARLRLAPPIGTSPASLLFSVIVSDDGDPPLSNAIYVNAKIVAGPPASSTPAQTPSPQPSATPEETLSATSTPSATQDPETPTPVTTTTSGTTSTQSATSSQRTPTPSAVPTVSPTALPSRTVELPSPTVAIPTESPGKSPTPVATRTPSECAADGDGDGVCDQLDNCPNVANTGQANRDNDLLGDACDDDDAAIDVIRARLRDNRGSPGRVIVRGESEGVDLASLIVGGVLAEVGAGDGCQATIAWHRDECVSHANGRVRCTAAGAKAARLDARIVSGHRTRFELDARAVDLGGPCVGPVRVHVVYAPAETVMGIDAVGVAERCRRTRHAVLCH